MHRRFLAGAKWLAIFLFASSVPLSSAHAHAKVVSSSPANGQKLTEAPREIRILFSESPVVAMSRLSLVRADGTATILAASIDPSNANAIVAQLPGLEAGTYSINWRVVPSDGHAARGKISFAIEAPAAKPDSQQRTSVATAQGIANVDASSIAIVPAILRGAALACLLGACGLLGFTAYSENGASERQQKLIRSLSGAATLLFLLHLAAWLAYVSPDGKLDRGFMAASLSTRIGADEMVRLVLCALAAWSAIVARRNKLAFAFALAAVIAGGIMGHPAAIHPAASIPLKAVHLVAVAFWMGGIIWLITSGEESVDAANSVSRVAIASISVVAISGVIETVLFLDQALDRINILYAALILAKIAGLFALGIFGNHHRTMIKRSNVGASFKRSLQRENIVMAVIVMIAGVLAYVPLS